MSKLNVIKYDYPLVEIVFVPSVVVKVIISSNKKVPRWYKSLIMANPNFEDKRVGLWSN